MDNLNTTLKTAADNLNMYNLAFDLGILSKLSYKYNNQHRVYKFFQAMKKVERNMRKFTNLNLRCFIQNECSLPPSLRFTNGFILELSSYFIKAFLYLHEARKSCVECAGYSLQILRVAHFVSLHTVVISVVSNVWNMVGELQNDIKNWYEALLSYSKNKNIQLPPFPCEETINFHVNSPTRDKVVKDIPSKAISALQKRFEGDKKINSIQAKLLYLAGDDTQDPDVTDDVRSIIQKENPKYSVDISDHNDIGHELDADSVACSVATSHSPSVGVDVGVAVTRKLVGEVNDEDLSEVTEKKAGEVKVKKKSTGKLGKKSKKKVNKESAGAVEKICEKKVSKKIKKKFSEKTEKKMLKKSRKSPINASENECEKSGTKKRKKKSIHNSIPKNELENDSPEKMENESKQAIENAVEVNGEHESLKKIKNRKKRKKELFSETKSFRLPTETSEGAKNGDDFVTLCKKRKSKDLNVHCAKKKRLKQISS